MKWVVLSLFLAGCLMLLVAWKMDSWVTYENGTFFGEMLLVLGGGLCVSISLVWMFVLMFVKL